MKYPHVRVKLVGEDGNIFFIMGRISAAMKRGGCTKEQVEEFTTAVTNCGSYDEALQTCMEFVDTY